MSKRVLIVDDDHSNRQLLFYALKAGNFDILDTASGKDALHLIEHHHFDVALIDIELPDVNGIEVVRALHQAQPHAVIMMSTATDSPEMLTKACQVGARIYLVKPFELPTILRLINENEPPLAEMRVIYSHTRETRHTC